MKPNGCRGHGVLRPCKIRSPGNILKKTVSRKAAKNAK
jgi:hypothetical protein